MRQIRRRCLDDLNMECDAIGTSTLLEIPIYRILLRLHGRHAPSGLTANYSAFVIKHVGSVKYVGQT